MLQVFLIMVSGVVGGGVYIHCGVQEFYQSLWRDADAVKARRKTLWKALPESSQKKGREKARSIDICSETTFHSDFFAVCEASRLSSFVRST